MDERRDLALAKRLARAIDADLVPAKGHGWSGWVLSRYPYVGWTEGSGSVLRGSPRETGLLDMLETGLLDMLETGLLDMLDMGRRLPRGKALPPAVRGCPWRSWT